MTSLSTDTAAPAFPAPKPHLGIKYFERSPYILGLATNYFEGSVSTFLYEMDA